MSNYRIIREYKYPIDEVWEVSGDCRSAMTMRLRTRFGALSPGRR